MKNPIFRKELMINGKSSKIAVIILTCNLLLWVFTVLRLLQMDRSIAQFQYIKNISFITLFRSIVMVEFLIIMVSVPIASALSITGDRERNTLELVLTSLVTPKEVIFGKAINSMFILGLTLFSTLPILSITFMYGGMIAVDFWTVFLLFLVTGFLLTCIGIYASSRTKDSIWAILSSFAFVVFLYVILIWVVIANWQGSAGKGTDAMALLVYNPIYTMLMYTNSIGGGQNFGELTRYTNGFSNHTLFNPFFLLGQILQVLTGIVFLLLSVKELRKY